MKISVIGLGYVGTVAAAGLASAGHEVLGVEIDRYRVDQLQQGSVPFFEPGLQQLTTKFLALGNIRFRHPHEVQEPIGDVALITTGTPPTESGGADLNQVRSAIGWLKTRGTQDTVVVMKSTVPPGTGLRLVERELDGTGLSYVANPEFLREGRAVEDWHSPDRIVIGAEPTDHRSVDVVKQMHAGIDAPFLVTDVTSAEMVKYASNAFLATRVSFINEIASLCSRVGASIDVVSEGLALDARTGSRIYAGVGYGGSCFPKDVRALDHLALTTDVNVELLRSVININNRQRLLPLHTLRQRFSGNLSGLAVGVLGLAFKPNTDDVRDAPSLDLIKSLVDEGVEVRAYDPQACEVARPLLPESTEFVNDPLEAADRAQALILVTEWEQIVNSDWAAMSRCMKPPRFFYDGRNTLDMRLMEQLGFEYVGVGRNSGHTQGTNWLLPAEVTSA